MDENIIKQKPTEYLVKMVTTLKSDYDPQAVNVALSELELRGLSSNDINDFASQLAVKSKSLEKNKLNYFQKILFFMSGLGVFTYLIALFFAAKYESKNELKKQKDCIRLAKYGFAFTIMFNLIFYLSRFLS